MHFAWRDWEKLQEVSVTIASALARVQTKQPLKLEVLPVDNLLSNIVLVLGEHSCFLGLTSHLASDVVPPLEKHGFIGLPEFCCLLVDAVDWS
jgi:hypothetical protein